MVAECCLTDSLLELAVDGVLDLSFSSKKSLIFESSRPSPIFYILLLKTEVEDVLKCHNTSFEI